MDIAFHHVERLVSVGTAVVVALLTTGFLYASHSLGLYRPSLLVIAASGYIVAASTLLHRPITGSLDRSVNLFKAVFLLLGLGAITGAAVELLVPPARASEGGNELLAVFLAVIGLALLASLRTRWIWRRYRERMQRIRDEYPELVD